MSTGRVSTGMTLRDQVRHRPNAECVALLQVRTGEPVGFRMEQEQSYVAGLRYIFT